MIEKREEIIKALECHANGKLVECERCPLDKAHLFNVTCVQAMCENALALIKELIEESQKWQEAYDCADSACRELSSKCDELVEENETLRDVVAKYEDILDKEHEHHQEMIGDLNEILSQIRYIKADTIQKMQERLRAETITIQDHTGKLGSVILVSAVDQIAKEMLEEDNV